MSRETKNVITEIFGKNLFSNENMKKYLPKEAYEELQEVIEHDKPLNIELANVVAVALKDWALSNGVTHYTHWFQPLTGETAEKHEAFISIDKEGNSTLEFTGKNLSKGETDASSFPTGGIRATFEARGYTLWDCSSPAFIKGNGGSANPILYIPTAFCSYNGEALDKKTPLLRSMEALNRACLKLLPLLGVDAKRVHSYVGAEQEYFLVPTDKYQKRYDLKYCGRTLFGVMPPKSQEAFNQYYGNIRKRVSDFMSGLNKELWELGITAKTQHNEVAPSQHELVPIFSKVNIATDQNQLIMESMKKVANENGLTCLLHEKPFAHMNGSGKHNNWSINTDTGINLFKPGKTPLENLPFLLMIIAVISAVDEYADLVRMSAANVGNERRLGGSEAPPSIISIFIGDDLESILNAIEEGQTVASVEKKYINTGVNYLAELSKDNSDRNRTSPFAFTGNKFEFRMVGSSATLANPNTTLNTITAEYVEKIAIELKENLDKGIDLKKAVYTIVKKYYKEHKRIIFKGNNYSTEWAKEAKKRGLPIINSCVEAYDVLLKEKNIALFEKHKVMNRKELSSRREIYLENYANTILLEAKTMVFIINNQILPAVYSYIGELSKDVSRIREAIGVVNINMVNQIKQINTLSFDVTNLSDTFEKNIETIMKEKNLHSKAAKCRKILVKGMDDLRDLVDSIEKEMPVNKWPIPTYADLLYCED